MCAVVLARLSVRHEPAAVGTGIPEVCPDFHLLKEPHLVLTVSTGCAFVFSRTVQPPARSLEPSSS